MKKKVQKKGWKRLQINKNHQKVEKLFSTCHLCAKKL